jgi:hypothetical protein
MNMKNNEFAVITLQNLLISIRYKLDRIRPAVLEIGRSIHTYKLPFQSIVLCSLCRLRSGLCARIRKIGRIKFIKNQEFQKKSGHHRISLDVFSYEKIYTRMNEVLSLS